MKRFMSLILCVMMVLPFALAACDKDPAVTTPDSTQETTAATTAVTTTQKQEEEKSPYEIRDIASKLISKWDFSGNTDDERLSDKSSLGASKEKITLSGEGATVTNGKLTIIDGPNFAAINVAQNSDLYDLKNKTLVFKARMTNNETQGYKNLMSTILSKESAYSMEFQNASRNRAGRLGYVLGGTRTNVDHGYTHTVSEWRVHAIVLEVNNKSRAGTLTLYSSTVEEPKSYKDFKEVVSIKLSNVADTDMVGTDKLFLGKRYNQSKAYRTLDSEFSAIQLYDMTLNLGEIASIDLSIDASVLLSEVTPLIAEAEKITRDEKHSDYEWNTFTATLAAAKALTAQSSAEEIKTTVNLLRSLLININIKEVPSVLDNLSMIPYNNPDLIVPIHSGIHANPGIYDIDGDGDMDFICSGRSQSYASGGIFAYRNTSNIKGTTVLASAQLLQYSADLPWYSYKTDGSSVFITRSGVMYTKLTNNGYEGGTTFEGLDFRFKLYDIDGDGLSDAVYTKGKSVGEATYDEQGNWLKSAKTSLAWIKNTGTEEAPVFNTGVKTIRNREGNEFTVHDETGYEDLKNIAMDDWDGDGDLDLIAGGGKNKFYYYENIGSSKYPCFADDSGVQIETVSGPLELDVCLFNIINYDWDGDGFDDLFIGSESGTTRYLRFTGRYNSTTGSPIFEDSVYMSQKADYLAVNALSRPTACDFDGDGDQDFLVGDNCGFLWFYENLTGGTNPSWAAPVQLKDEKGKVLVIKAGPSGSLQGAGESEWGYLVPCACDWDGDGDIDVIFNSVNGRVEWYENIGTATAPQLTAAKAVEVEWNGATPYPDYIYPHMRPAGKELVVPHRTTPYAIDFNGDGLCDIVMMDHEHYLVFFERYKEGGVLKLKPGQRIFADTNGNPIMLNPEEEGDGLVRGGRVKLVVTDWNCDGKLDVVMVENANASSPTAEIYLTQKIENGKYYLKRAGNVGTGTVDIHGHHQGLTVVDWDADGDEDIVFGSESGYFYYVENTTK